MKTVNKPWTKERIAELRALHAAWTNATPRAAVGWADAGMDAILEALDEIERLQAEIAKMRPVYQAYYMGGDS